MLKANIMDHFLGIEGLTIGGAGIWTLVVLAFGAVLRQWVAGIADRKRAENEGMTAKEKAEQAAHIMLLEQMQKQFDMMQRQNERMEKEIDGLKKRVADLEETERKHLLEIAELKGMTK